MPALGQAVTLASGATSANQFADTTYQTVSPGTRLVISAGVQDSTGALVNGTDPETDYVFRVNAVDLATNVNLPIITDGTVIASQNAAYQLNAFTTTAATNLVDSAAQTTTPQSAQLTLNEGAAPTNATPTQIGGNLGPSTPENTGMTQERLDQLQTRYDNMRSPEFFNYFKAVNDVLGTYVNRGYMTPDQAKEYQGRLETAASAPNASLTSLQGAVPMPQISDFLQPTGTPAPVTYTAPSQPITDRSAYINDLYKQLGANVSQGLLAVPQAQTLQSQLREAYLNPQSTTEQLQGIYNTGMQQYRPLI